MPKDKQPCCEWKGRKNAKGYGIVLINGKQFFVHRLAVALSGRDIPKNKVCDHLCRNHSCYNPDHIELVSIQDNVMRGGGISAQSKRRATCSHGHLLDEKNTRIHTDKKGRTTRHCRRCYADRAIVNSQKGRTPNPNKTRRYKYGN